MSIGSSSPGIGLPWNCISGPDQRVTASWTSSRWSSVPFISVRITSRPWRMWNDSSQQIFFMIRAYGAYEHLSSAFWLMIAAASTSHAIISQKALLKCSYAPYARIMKKICWEESFHILHGRDVVLTLMNGTDAQRELVQEAVTRWWGPLMQFHGNPISKEEDPMYVWRIKSQGNEEARQQFLDGYVPQIWELGLTVPDPKLRKNDDGVWEYSEPDWDEMISFVTGHGP